MAVKRLDHLNHLEHALFVVFRLCYVGGSKKSSLLALGKKFLICGGDNLLPWHLTYSF
jgi:hypothetical protein